MNDYCKDVWVDYVFENRAEFIPLLEKCRKTFAKLHRPALQKDRAGKLVPRKRLSLKEEKVLNEARAELAAFVTKGHAKLFSIKSFVRYVLAQKMAFVAGLGLSSSIAIGSALRQYFFPSKGNAAGQGNS